jgi:hypothetical protein
VTDTNVFQLSQPGTFADPQTAAGSPGWRGSFVTSAGIAEHDGGHFGSCWAQPRRKERAPLQRAPIISFVRVAQRIVNSSATLNPRCLQAGVLHHRSSPRCVSSGKFPSRNARDRGNSGAAAPTRNPM